MRDFGANSMVTLVVPPLGSNLISDVGDSVSTLGSWSIVCDGVMARVKRISAGLLLTIGMIRFTF